MNQMTLHSAVNKTMSFKTKKKPHRFHTYIRMHTYTH